jgi:hypothetical protein
MKAHRTLISCPECGEQLPLLWREIKRNQNLTITCLKCGLVYLAFNAVRLAIYNRLKELGHTVGKLPTPEPIDPVRIFPAEEGFEWVSRRYKTTGPSLYRRRIRSRKGRTES